MRVYSKRVGGIPPQAVYVGRPTKWGNPFVVGVHGKQGECVELYRKWLMEQPALIQQAREELRGKDLVCWCAPLPCHADVLMKMANE
jgi:hypothetical protein